MGKASDKERAKQLGMSMTNAHRLLARMVVFRLFQRLGEDFCYRCGKKIETLKDFSFDHKEPWLHISADLFWDVSNIAASHRTCNTSVRRGRPKKFSGDVKAVNRQQFASYYADSVKRDKWNARRRELYAKKHTVEDKVVESSGFQPEH